MVLTSRSLVLASQLVIYFNFISFPLLQVNQGVQEYTIFLHEPQLAAQPKKHTERLKEVYR